MQNSLKKMLARMFADKKRQRRIVAIVCVLSVLVTTTVFTELMQPVITMTPDPVCGQAEHAHGADCFANQLVCDAAESEEHAHGDDCYKNVLVCSKSEHVHTEKCYPKTVEEKKVTVTEPTEVPSTEAPAVTGISEDELTVEATVEVTAEPTAEATVEVTAEPTVEATVEPTVEATVAPAAPAVTVTAVSAEKVFVGQTVTWTIEVSGEAELTYYIVGENGEGISSGVLDAEASHISWLADRTGVFTMTVTAANETGSVSVDGSVTVEASEALTAAVRSDALSCFAGEEITFRVAYSGGVEPAAVSITVDQDGKALAELSEFAETVTVTPANLGEKETTVTAEITVTDSLGSTVTGVCEIPCAVRTRENESDWEKSTRVDLTGEWPEDLIAVAETQLGYKESEINFIVNDDGERQGYTRYGQWYGSSYAEWCAMFVSFNLNYAEIPEKYFPREANCEKWITALKPRGLYESADGGYEPEVGDLVFFDWEDNGESDHVGIITAVTDKKIETIEGNAGKGVRRRDYDRDDKVLYGYGCVLEAYENYMRDELDLDLETGVGAQAVVTAETANLCAEADAESDLVAQLTIDTVVDVTAAEQNRAEIWYQVTAGEHTGYIRSDLIEINYIAVEALVPVIADYDSLMNRIAELPFDGSEAHALTAAGIADEAAFAYESGMLTDEQYAEIIAALTAGSIMTLEENSEAMTLEEDGKITVTFEIDHEAYINDNGNTHVRIESEELYQLFSANGMTTAAEPWDGKPGWYKVTSTGILVKYEIDAGSTLSAAGFATPDVEIYNPSNIKLENTYVSSYSWVSRDEANNATVCGADTAFEADTTLYLQLYSSDSIYYLDYVCCENCNQSISFATSSLYAHPSIQLGRAVDDQYIPKAAAVNSAFECDSSVCASSCRSSTNDKVFDHWYLKNTKTNEIVEFGSTVRITADYLNRNDYGNTIKVYAVWTDAPEMVSNLAFRDSDYTTLGTVDEVKYGTTIDELINANRVVAPALAADDCEFIGWTFGDGSTIVDGTHKVTASDTTYQAVYKAKVYVKIPDIENGALSTYSTSEYTAQTGQSLLNAVDAEGNSISAILERESVTNGYMFGGWTLEQGSNSPQSGVTDFTNTTANAAVTLTAEYSKAITITFRYLPDGETEYVVVETYYVKNGGTINEMVDENGNSVTVDSVSIPGYTVNQWSNANGMPSYAYGQSTQIYADIVFTATVTALPAHTVTFQYLTEGDGVSEMTTAATYKAPVSGAMLRDIIAEAESVEATAVQLPECPLTMDTRYFSHWATAEGTVAALDTSITADTTFEAVFADKALAKFQYGYYSEELEETITGAVGEYYVIPGKPLSDSMTELPVVEIPGQRFCGWILMDGGVQTEINLDTVIPEGTVGMTLTAILNTEISISFGYQDAMDSDNDENIDEFIPVATYTMLLNQEASEAQRVVVDQDGNETIEKLTRIPDAPILENYTFTGWYYTIGDTAAELTDLSALDYLSENVTVVANYEKSVGCTVTFHDIDPDGNELTIETLVPAGEALEGYLSGVSLKDRTADEVIKWYTIDANGVKTEYDPSQPVTTYLELYTYTYRIVLTLADSNTAKQTASLLDILMPRAYAATVTVSGNQLTIVAEAGEKLKASDFVIDGVDYSLYTWTDDDGKAQYVSSLIGQEITESKTLTVSDSIPATNKARLAVTYYVNADGSDQKIGTVNLDVYYRTEPFWVGGKDYYDLAYYLSPAQLQFLFGNYGLSADTYHNNIGDIKYWDDVDYMKSASKTADIYGKKFAMVAHTEEGAPKKFEVYYTSSASTITVQDPSNVVYTAEECKDMSLAVNPGEDVEITLSTIPKQPVEGMTVEWKVYNGSGTEITTGFEKTVNEETVTFNFESVSGQYVLKPVLALPEGTYALTYHINIKETLADASPVPTINGSDEFTVYIQETEGGKYTLLYPTALEYSVAGNSALLAREFGGWAFDSTAPAANFAAGEEVDISTLIAKAKDRTIDLYACWTRQTSEYSVSYYVHLGGEMMTYSASGPSTEIKGNADWTDALYATSLTLSATPPRWETGSYPADIPISGENGGKQGIVLYDTSSHVSNVDSSKTTDAVIRSDLLTGVNAIYDDEEITFSIGAVPTNNQIIQTAQDKQTEYIQAYNWSGYSSVKAYVNAGGKIIYVENADGSYTYVPAEEITTTNYTVKWYVLKYEGNGWHIDGALVRKEGKLRITKTFYGDADMIQAAKNGFNITVNDANGAVVHRLELDDSAKNSFSWVVDVNQGATYTVKENNYYVNNVNEKTTSAEYRITNSNASGANRWHVYNGSGVRVTAVAYADNETNYQTVNFLNSYVPENTLILRKVDALGNVLTGVEFALTKDGDTAEIYTMSGQENVYYLYKPEESAVQFTGNLEVNSDGVFWIKWPEDTAGAVYGDYTLEEVITPEGYEPVKDITFTLSADGIAAKSGFKLDDGTDNATLNGFNIVAIDRPKTTDVKVVKQWAGTEETKPVELQLYRDGALYGTVTLDGVRDTVETDPWEYTWSDMELYSGNSLTEYRIFESKIGADMFDTTSDSTDGYADYTVTQSIAYYKGNTLITSDADKVNATDAVITVTNTLDKNNIVFTKEDDAGAMLSGATFTLYNTNGAEIATAISGTDGYVVFSDLLPGDYYVMQETGTPEGYQNNDMKYLVNVNGNNVTINETIEGEDGTLTATGDPITSVVNTLIPCASVTVKKVDASSNALNGATFLIRKDGNPYTYDGTNTTFSAYPSTTLSDLPAGTYTITETQAPTGYYGMSDTISFTITDGAVAITAADGVTVDSTTGDAEGNGWTYTASTNTFTVTNTPGVELPSTGGAGTLPYTIGGLLLMAASLLYGFGQRRKDERGDAV